MHKKIKKESCRIRQPSYICQGNANNKIRNVVLYKDYFTDFYLRQRPKVRSKIDWTIRFVEEHQHIPESIFKHIESSRGLYEIRVLQGSDTFRIFCFFDENKIVVAINGFQKKAQKTPKQDIDRAVKIKNEYFYEKKH